jgi:hypothetical protein
MTTPFRRFHPIINSRVVVVEDRWLVTGRSSAEAATAARSNRRPLHETITMSVPARRQRI